MVSSMLKESLISIRRTVFQYALNKTYLFKRIDGGEDLLSNLRIIPDNDNE